MKENEKLLCDSMLHEIDRVTGLINDLFTLSVKKENHRHVFPADAVLREVASIYAKECEQQNVTFETDCVACEVFADENEMRQMLYNLLTNRRHGEDPSLSVFRRRYDYILRLRQWKRNE